ncbi:gamma-glutamylcyclotransferase family protein [Streptomyces monomycini]|uniref:gamma-glutamylcyclotransferase family protein n=1 Tax=Streptomyces monomycini TaxID=371720 RepID=UPI00067CC48A|nr:gamma-glutamylcyclotransferase family protein [Streptomyces monomycini]
MTTEPERLPFFVYGTLRPGRANHARCLRGRTASEESALVRGVSLYEGPGYPYAVPGPAEAVVHGDLIAPREDAYDSVRAALDRLEGYVPGGPGNLYERVARQAECVDGRSVRAWMYVAAAPLAARLRASGPPIPGGDWLRGRAAGAPPCTAAPAARPAPPPG